jgi:hypothetical protein
MGTSQSNPGPGGGVPMVPPWADNLPAENSPATPQDAEGAPQTEGPDENGDGKPAHPEPKMPPIEPAPLRRFAGSSRNLGDYARTGDRSALERGVGQYVNKGYGGAGTATRRLGSTATTAGSLGSVLSRLSGENPPQDGSALDPTLLAGKSADAIMDAVVEAARPVDGTQDAEASRASIRDAMSDMLTKHPDADLFELTGEQREAIIENYAANDVFRRFELDIGKTIRDKAPSVSAGLSRLGQARDYIKQTVAAAFRGLRDTNESFSERSIVSVVRSAIREAFEVFEEYAL